MLGNVDEWTCSAYDERYGGAEGRCDASSEYRSVRISAWNDGPAKVRVAFRRGHVPGNRYFAIGFRPARSP